LSYLELKSVGTSGQPLDLGTLPGSLTALKFVDCTVSYSDTSSSASSCAVQLPLLQQLDANMANPESNPQHVVLLLLQASALRYLNFWGDCRSFLSRASGMLSQQQSLQRIQLYSASSWRNREQQRNWDPAAAQLAAVTSSSQLSSLELTCWRWPAGAVQHMFPAGRQLQRLQDLSIEFTAGWELAPGAGWELEPGDISCIVAGCPNLRCLFKAAGIGEFVGVGRISTSELQQLRQLTALSSLSIGKPRWDTAAAAVLADLTGGCMALAFHERGGGCCFMLCRSAAAELRVATVLQTRSYPISIPWCSAEGCMVVSCYMYNIGGCITPNLAGTVAAVSCGDDESSSALQQCKSTARVPLACSLSCLQHHTGRCKPLLHVRI
jgi:hypothetical protein